MSKPAVSAKLKTELMMKYDERFHPHKIFTQNNFIHGSIRRNWKNLNALEEIYLQELNCSNFRI